MPRRPLIVPPLWLVTLPPASRLTPKPEPLAMVLAFRIDSADDPPLIP